MAKIVKEKIKNLIKIEGLKGEDYLFLNRRKKKYNVRSIQQIIKKAAKKSGIKNWKEIHPHTLRHSFAIHPIEDNYSVNGVQAMLGHKSPKTSLSYICKSGKMINIKSPLDNI